MHQAQHLPLTCLSVSCCASLGTAWMTVIRLRDTFWIMSNRDWMVGCSSTWAGAGAGAGAHIVLRHVHKAEHERWVYSAVLHGLPCSIHLTAVAYPSVHPAQTPSLPACYFQSRYPGRVPCCSFQAPW